MKLLILAPPTPQGEKHVQRVKKFLNTLGHDSVWVRRDARDPMDALRLVGGTIAVASECDGVFWDSGLWDWRTGNVIADVLKRYSVRIFGLKSLMTMEAADGEG